jgi:hypothetical protein
VQLLVFAVLGLSGMLVSYAFGQGGPVGGLVFLSILFVGVFLRAARPLLDLLKP